MDEILDITLFLAGVFEALGVPYLVGGSLASSIHGTPRATLDVDFVAALTREHVAPFVDALRGQFYVDEGAVRDAVERQGSFNVIHLGSYFKADTFIAKDDEASQLQMARRRRLTIGSPPQHLSVATPEDVITQKLYWFSLGDEKSDRQWRDAVGVLKVAGPTLDNSYLDYVAGLLGVRVLLVRARAEAAGDDAREQ